MTVFVAFVAALAAVIGSCTWVGAQEASAAAGTPAAELLPPDAPVLGRSLGEWGAAWERWFAEHPDSAEDCAQGDQREVWFLPGLPADAEDLTVTIDCTIASGRAVFFPIFSTYESTAEECGASVDEGIGSVGGLEAFTLTVDGQVVPDLARFRFPPSPLPPPSGTPAAGSPAASHVSGENWVACGYSAMLAPLTEGKHTVRLLVEPEGQVLVDLTWRLTVVPTEPA